jgi:hypothetical protein
LHPPSRRDSVVFPLAVEARHGWRFPILFLEVKGLVGCRITELASASTQALTDSRIVFGAATTKGRKQPKVRLLPEVFEELRLLAGPTFIFETFSDALRTLHTRRIWN